MLDGLLEGFAWDAAGRTYEDEADMLAYAARVASTVGVLMTLLMGRREADTLARACDLGLAMQLTNIARDVGEDARNGRLYLPRRWMREAGLDPDAWLANPVFDARLAQVVRRLLALAGEAYARSRGGIRHLPRDCRAAIHAARLVYSEIGARVARNGYDSVTGRAYVSGRRKLALISRAAMAAVADFVPVRHAPAGVEPEIVFLLQAVAQERRAPRVMRQPILWPVAAALGFRNRTVGVLALLERTEHQRFGAGDAGGRAAAEVRA